MTLKAETALRHNKWRVRRMFAMTDDEPPTKVYLHAWGIWPPEWDLDGKPLLMYMTQTQAMNEAAKRADFVATPPVTQEDWDM